MSYPAAVKKEPEPPKKDAQKFRHLRNQWEKMSGLTLPNRQQHLPSAANNPRVNQADNLRTNRHSQPTPNKHLSAQKTQSR